MFQLKNFVSIAASMLNYVRSTTGKVTDLQPGSVTRTILEAPAAEIEELYVQVFNGIKEAIPVAIYQSIDFKKLSAQHAAGRVTVVYDQTMPAPFVVPQGTQFLARDGRIYVTKTDLTWPAGADRMTFPVLSLNPGNNQNLAAGEINASPTFSPDHFSFVSSDMTGGADVESDAARDIRFADYISSISRGTEAALLYGARSAKLYDSVGNIIESVQRASLEVISGSVTVHIWGSNGEPSDALVLRADEIEKGYVDPVSGEVVPGFSAAGISCAVAKMKLQPVDVDYTVVMLNGYTFDANTTPQLISDALGSFLATKMPGDTVYIDDIKNQALTVRGVASATVNINANVVVNPASVLVVGKVRVTSPVVAPVVPTVPGAGNP
ncbi:hypothetical protein EU642_22090 [Salmonella enterica]|nr:hypothetical protein [Salmonella enterica]EAO0118545.1 hypothetical protein [Salmonella enterica]EAO3601650.1 hypothetical protein [Salmonella enterica]EAR6391543.1 hypothetical protein [Salmonella enterica]EAV1285307.1 hypothetical protein [Salmonella enterica]